MVIEYINDLSREIERVITSGGQTSEQMETELLEIQFWGMVQLAPVIMWIAHRHLPAGTELSIQPHRTQGYPYYVIYARFPDHCEPRSIQDARSELESLAHDKWFSLYLVPDQQRSTQGGWTEIVSPYCDKYTGEAVVIYLMGHIIEKMPCESDVFAVHARGTTVRNAAWFKLQRVVKELITESMDTKWMY